MTLKEFVKAFMEANNIDKDVDAMCKHIAEEAQKVQQNGCACLDEEQVEKIILGAKLEALPVEHHEIKKVYPKPAPKPEEKKEEKKVADQLDIFSLGVGLYD